MSTQLSLSFLLNEPAEVLSFPSGQTKLKNEITRQMSDDEIVAKALEIIEKRRPITEGTKITSADNIKDYLKLKVGYPEREEFWVVALTSQHDIIECKKLFSGTIDSAAIYPREVVKWLLSVNASSAIISHNHPSGLPDPSQADRHITERIRKALELVEIRLLDHIILGHERSCSFAELGLL